MVQHDMLSQQSLARLLVGDRPAYRFEKASILVGRAAYRSGGESMRVAIGQARDAERRARKAVLQEQAERGSEREALAKQEGEHIAWRNGATERLEHALSKVRHCD